MHKCRKPEYTRVIRKSVFDDLTIVILRKKAAVTVPADFMERYGNCDAYQNQGLYIRDSRESGYGKTKFPF